MTRVCVACGVVRRARRKDCIWCVIGNSPYAHAIPSSVKNADHSFSFRFGFGPEFVGLEPEIAELEFIAQRPWLDDR